MKTGMLKVTGDYNGESAQFFPGDVESVEISPFKDSVWLTVRTSKKDYHIVKFQTLHVAHMWGDIIQARVEEFWRSVSGR